MDCKIWREVDREDGSTVEYCKSARSSCTCSGVKHQCNFPEYFKEDVDVIKMVHLSR